MDKLLSALRVEATDVRVLMLARKLKARRRGYFTHEEWRLGMKLLKADTLKELQKRLPGLEKEVVEKENSEEFTTIPSVTDNQRPYLDIMTTSSLLDDVLRSRFKPHVTAFVKYLKVCRINLMAFALFSFKRITWW
ncbi:uncharacterized protein LOC143556852 [Bidens hawaiensis]|uniref:uncharacterized protein LOC143556852 n=1 Tax=Bidens hawaiensis TaxID=980011 RepID=UPI00404A0AE3